MKKSIKSGSAPVSWILSRVTIHLFIIYSMGFIFFNLDIAMLEYISVAFPIGITFLYIPIGFKQCQVPMLEIDGDALVYRNYFYLGEQKYNILEIDGMMLNNNQLIFACNGKRIKIHLPVKVLEPIRMQLNNI